MILIKNAQIVDGSGKPPFKGDLLIKDSQISAIGSFPDTKAETIIDGLGLTITPGFIDAHSTSDHYLSLFSNPSQEDFLLQGVTTIIGGHCGSSLAPLLYGSLKSIQKWADINKVNVGWANLSELKETLRKIKIGTNFGTLIGHSTIRRDLIGEDIRDLTQTELEIFQNMIAKAMEEGALGMSTGLGYSHSRQVPYSEIKNLLSVLAKTKGVYTTHLRDETEDLPAAVSETIQVAAETGVPVIISHLRPIIGFENKFQEAIKLIETSLDRSNVYFEINPFGASIIPIYTFLPVWAQQGGKEAMLEILKDQRHRSEILEELPKLEVSFEKLIIAEAYENDPIIGRTLKEFSEGRQLSIHEGLLRLMEITKMRTLFFYKNTNSDLLTQALLNPRSLIGSNSPSLANSQAMLRPERSINTFPQFLKVALSQSIPIEEIIKKITLVPAKIFNLQKRGMLAEGWQADIAMLKDEQIINVIVNGQIAVKDKKMINPNAGDLL